MNVTINKVGVALQETNASINTLYEGGAKPRKVGDDEAEDMEGGAAKRRAVPGSSKLKISDVRNLSDDAD